MESRGQENVCLIDEILLELDNGRQSMKKQVAAMSEILEKSNSVLLQIEATRCLKPPAPRTPTTPVYTYNEETLHLLTKIVESFSKIDEHIDSKEQTSKNEPTKRCNFESFLIENKQKSDCLGVTIRKLLAINDAVIQMKLNLKQNEEAGDTLSE